LPIKPSSRWEKTPRQSPQSEITSVLRESEKKGKKVIDLMPGDPPAWGFYNQNLSKYLIEAANEGWHTYTGRRNEQGLKESPSIQSQLQDAISTFEKRERDIDFNPNKIFPCGGCAGALMCIHYSMLDEGDEVVILEPAHYLSGPTSYFPYLRAEIKQSLTVEENGWQPDLEDLRSKLSNRTKAIVVNNPNNPTGAIYDEKMLREIVDIAGEHDLPIISDEIYGLITYDGVVAKSTAAVAGDVPVIVIGGMSKIFMRTGWRVGYIAFHDPEEKAKELLDTTRKVWRMYGHQARSMPIPMYYAATKAFLDKLDAGREMLHELEARRDYSIKRINDNDRLSCITPKGAFYIFPKIEDVGQGMTWKTEVDFLKELANTMNLGLNPGSMYGEHGNGHFRAIFLPKIEVLEEVYNKLDEFISKKVC
jgi:aspartate/methionine/tyrosine aminotransferase